MKHTTPILQRTVTCPKCQRKTMRQSIPQRFEREYFCDYDHEYFSISELVNEWGYDAGDLYPQYPLIILHQKYAPFFHKNVPHPVEEEKLVSTNWFDTMSVYPIDEPVWKSEFQKLEAYEMVDRMFLGIPEWEEGCDNHGIDIGLEGWPI